MKIVTVDMNHRVSCPRLFARLVWQELFNIYRHPIDGGNLNRMDSLLCDLYTLTNYFESDDNFTIYWKYDGWFTIIQDYNDNDAPIYEISFDVNTYLVTIKPAWKDE